MTRTPTRLPSPVPPPADVADLRRAITELGARGAAEVDAVRRAFLAGTPPLQTAGSGSASDFVSRFGGSGSVAAEVTRSTSRFGTVTSVVGTLVAPPRPEIDLAEIGSDRFRGVLDSFFVRVVISMPTEDLPRVSYVRILRAPNGAIDAPTPTFSAMMDSTPRNINRKNSDPVAMAAYRVADIGEGNVLTRTLVDDPFFPRRSVVSSGNLRPLPAPPNTNRRGTGSGLLSIANADRKVLEDVTFLVNRRSQAPVQELDLPLTVGQRQGLNVIQGSSVGQSNFVESSNASGFSEVGRLTFGRAPTVGAFSELEFFDPSVVYGSSFSYYAVAVDRDGIEGPRSRIVRVDVVRARPPATPEVLYSVVAGRPRFSLRCSGPYLDHIEIFRRGGPVPGSVTVIGSTAGRPSTAAPVTTDSGFSHIGDVGLGVDRSSTFVDSGVKAGQSLEYRIYAVDSFGYKSPTPFSCSIRLPDRGRPIPLTLPSITAEQTVGGRVVRVTVTCEDPRITSFVIGRRNLTTLDDSYRQPTTPDYFTLGTPSSAKRGRAGRSGPTLNGSSARAWSGVLPAVSGSAQMVDTAVEFDRIYQYSVRAVDVRGNFTDPISSAPLMVAVKPVSEAPVAIAGVLGTGSAGPSHVLITWSGGTDDFSPNDLVGDQDVLAATSVRSVYQVERRAVGQSLWEVMPATTASHFVDPISDDEPPKFRPPYASVGVGYDYRVIAMQSGAFLSTYTDPVRVFVGPDLTPPPLVWVRSTPSAVRPIAIAVSWQYEGTFVDSWEVQRAVTNKLFGSKIMSMDSREARGLRYEQVARVTRESSRSRGVSTPRRMDPRIAVGNRLYLDQDVDLANSYFYRIRALDLTGRTSDWTYAGLSLTDSPHDRKLMSSLSDDERASLANDPRPITFWRNR